MDHGYFKDRISAYHDRNLKPEEEAVIEEHLKECAECRRMLEDFRKLDALVEEHSGLDGGDYWEKAARRIESRLDGETATGVTEISRPRGWGMAWKLVAVAASVTVLTVVGLHRDEIWKDAKQSKEKVTEPAVVPSADSTDTDRDKGGGDDLGAVSNEVVQEETTTIQEVEEENSVVPVKEYKSTPNITQEATSRSEPTQLEPAEPEPAKPEPTKSFLSAPKPVEPEPAIEAVREGAPAVKKTERAKLSDSPAAAPEAETGAVMKSTSPHVSNITAKPEIQDATDLEETPEPGMDEFETDFELALLRRQMDSLVNLAGKEKKWDAPGLTSTLTEDKSRSSLAPTKQPSPEEVENELVRVCFKIGMLTGDEKEFDEVRGIIEKVAKDAKSPNRKLAGSYLQQLDDR